MALGRHLSPSAAPRLLRPLGRDAPGGRRDGIRWHGCGLRGASTGDPREGRELASTPLLRLSQRVSASSKPSSPTVERRASEGDAARREAPGGGAPRHTQEIPLHPEVPHRVDRRAIGRGAGRAFVGAPRPCDLAGLRPHASLAVGRRRHLGQPLYAPSPFDADRYLRLLYGTTVMGEQIVGF